jgi:hypothetical protein
MNSLQPGEIRLVKELKLANENLRWRLQQRNKVINDSKFIIEHLKTKLLETEKALAAANANATRKKK